MTRLREKYEKEIVPVLIKEFGLKNTLAAPKVSKVVVNMGVGDAVKDKGNLEKARKDLEIIGGQVPSVRKAKVSVASFNVRKGMPVGVTVTLRGDRMYSFLDKFFSIVLPRLRDFRGLKLKSFDKGANYSVGIEDHTVFPEVDLAQSQSRGLEVTIVTNTEDRKRAKKLFELMGMPFEKKE